MRDLHIYSNIIDIKTIKNINKILDNPALSGCRIRIMPNITAEATCISGLTSTIGNKFIPELIGNDIGCGILMIELGKIDIDIIKLDDVIKKYVPYGRNIHKKRLIQFFDESKDDTQPKPYKRFERCLGTLGGGSHFIEVDEDRSKNKYLLIHSGSRGYGLKLNVCYNFNEYSSEKARNDYFIEDMQVCMKFAAENRNQIAKLITENMNFEEKGRFDTFHNYIDFENKIMRKGAVSAKENEKVIIPINNKKGCILAIGKGNKDWNLSAPANAERIIDKGISIKDSLKTIDATVEVKKIIKPIYNLKAE